MKLLPLIILSMLSCNVVMAKDVIGRITKLRGTVVRSNVKAKIGEELLKEGSEIYVGDTVESENGSFAKVLMKDDTIFSIGPETEFAFEHFKEKKGADRDATYKLVRGKLRSLFTKKAPRRSLKIKTPTASMAVRGTEIVSDVYLHKGSMKTDIGLLSGKLEVESRGKIVKMNPREFFESKREMKKGKKIEFAKRKLDDRVFDLLRKSQKKGGESFLNDAFNKAGLKRKADFSKVTFKKIEVNDRSIASLKKAKALKGRAPASALKPAINNPNGKNPYTVLEDVQGRKGNLEDLKRQNAERRLQNKADPVLNRKRMLGTRTMPTIQPCPVGQIRISGVCRIATVPTTLSGSTTTSGTRDTDRIILEADGTFTNDTTLTDTTKIDATRETTDQITNIDGQIDSDIQIKETQLIDSTNTTEATFTGTKTIDFDSTAIEADTTDTFLRSTTTTDSTLDTQIKTNIYTAPDDSLILKSGDSLITSEPVLDTKQYEIQPVDSTINTKTLDGSNIGTISP